MNSSSLRRSLFALLAVAIATPAFAHQGHLVGGFASGLAHPLLGPDHVVAMVAVGLWAAFAGRPSVWILPLTFPIVMAIGGALGMAGMALPHVETAIALSAVVLGALIAFSVRVPIWAAVGIVGTFALFHGHAHGTELPGAADPVTYALGFLLATCLLHLAGIGLGRLSRWPAGRLAVRSVGATIASAGIAFLVLPMA